MGFGVIQGDRDPSNPDGFMNINPPAPNKSADLKLLVPFAKQLSSFFGIHLPTEDIDGFPPLPNTDTWQHIQTVVDAKFAFAKLLMRSGIIARSRECKYDTWIHRADMHIYSDMRPYTFDMVHVDGEHSRVDTDSTV